MVSAPRASTLIYGIAKGASDGVWLVPANACPAVPLALVQADVAFEFIDIDPSTLCIDVGRAAARTAERDRPRVAGIVYIRTYGHAPAAQGDLERLKGALGDDGILIDDQCLAPPLIDPAEYQSWGADVAVWSTGYAKVVDLGGGGHALFFSDLEYIEPRNSPRAGALDRIIADYKQAFAADTPLYATLSAAELEPWVPFGEGLGWAEVQTRLAGRLFECLAHKAAINAIYRTGLAQFDPLPDPWQIWRFNIRVENPGSVLCALFAAGLFASDHFDPASRLWGVGDMPNARALQANIVNLLNDDHFSIEQAAQAVQVIRQSAEPWKSR